MQASRHADLPFKPQANKTHILLASMTASGVWSAHDYRGCKFQRRRRQIDARRSSGRLAARAGAHASRLPTATPSIPPPNGPRKPCPTSRPSGSPTPTRSSTACRPSGSRPIMSSPTGRAATPRPAGRCCLRADLAIVPCKASMLEVRALAQATNVLRQAQDIRGGQPQAIIVLSMVGKNYRLTQDMKDAAAALELPLAKTALTLQADLRRRPGPGGRRLALGCPRPRGGRRGRSAVPRDSAGGLRGANRRGGTRNKAADDEQERGV